MNSTTVGQKMAEFMLNTLTLSDINRFSKIRISGFGVKYKPKIRICQSGTDMQTLQ